MSMPSPHNRLLCHDDLVHLFTPVFGPNETYCVPKYQAAFVHNSFLKRADLKETFALLAENTDINNNNDDNDAYRDVLAFNPGGTYQRLELLGDACVHLALTRYLIARFPRANEGILTSMRIKLECKETLAKFGLFLHLDKYILISNDIEEKGLRTQERFMEDVFEAFCASLYQDKGEPAVYVLIKYLLENTIDFRDLVLVNENYKSLLMAHFHTLGWASPSYGKIAASDKETMRVGVVWFPYMKSVFPNPIPVSVQCTDANGKAKTRTQKMIMTAHASVKKKAEQKVAQAVLRVLQTQPSIKMKQDRSP